MNDQERAERRRHNLREQLRRANAERAEPPPYCLRCGAPHTDPCKREEGT